MSRVVFGDPELDVCHVSYLVIRNWMEVTCRNGSGMLDGIQIRCLLLAITIFVRR